MDFVNPEDAMKYLATVERLPGATKCRVSVDPNAINVTGVAIGTPKPKEVRGKSVGLSQRVKFLVTSIGGLTGHESAKVVASSDGIVIEASVKARVGRRVGKDEEGETKYVEAPICIGDIIDVSILRWGSTDAEKFLAASVRNGGVYNLAITPSFMEPPEHPNQRPSFDAFVPKSADEKGPLVGYTPLAKSPCDAVAEMARLCASVSAFDPRIGSQPRWGFAFFNGSFEARDVEGNKLRFVNRATYAVEDGGEKHHWVSVVSDSLCQTAMDTTKWERATVAFRGFGNKKNPWELPSGYGDLKDKVRGFAIAAIDKDRIVDPDTRRHSVSMGVDIVPTDPVSTYIVVDFPKTLRALADDPNKVLNEYTGPGLYFEVSRVAVKFGDMRPSDLPQTFSVIRSPDASDPAMRVMPLPTDILDFYDIVSAADKDKVITCRNFSDDTAPFIFAIRKAVAAPLVAEAEAEPAVSGTKRPRDEIEDLFDDDKDTQPKKKKAKASA